MNREKQLQDLNVNFDGKIAIYYDDLKGNVIKINEKEKYIRISCLLFEHNINNTCMEL